MSVMDTYADLAESFTLADRPADPLPQQGERPTDRYVVLEIPIDIVRELGRRRWYHAAIRLGPIQLYASYNEVHTPIMAGEGDTRRCVGHKREVWPYLRMGMTLAQYEAVVAEVAGFFDRAECEFGSVDRYAEEKEYFQLAFQQFTYNPDGSWSLDHVPAGEPGAGEIISKGISYRPLELGQDGECRCGAYVSSNRKQVICPACGRPVGLT